VQSGIKMMVGPDAKAVDFEYMRVEDQKEIWKEAKRIGRLIAEQLQKGKLKS
jgi:diadenosine tetraphosphate (Ap4A) HIT family hydrolase